MDISLGSVASTVANVSSRKSDSGKAPESSLYEFLGTMSNYGIQVKSNFEVEFLQMPGFQFFAQSISVPGMKSSNATLYYNARSVEVPVQWELEHTVSMTVIADAKGFIYPTLRTMMMLDYSRKLPSNGYVMTVKARSDQVNTGGMNAIFKGVRFTEIGSLSFAHSDSGVQTFDVTLYVNNVLFQGSNVERKDGLLGKVDKLSNKMSQVLGM